MNERKAKKKKSKWKNLCDGRRRSDVREGRLNRARIPRTESGLNKFPLKRKGAISRCFKVARVLFSSPLISGLLADKGVNSHC